MTFYLDQNPGSYVPSTQGEFLYFGGTSYLGLQTDQHFQEMLISNIRKLGTNFGASRKSNVRLSVYEHFEKFISENPDLVKKRLEQVINTDKEVFINVFKIYAETEMITWLKNIKKPCLLMTGENDGGCSPYHNNKMFNEIENSKLVIVPEVKHSFLIEAPDQVSKNLINFLSSI